MAATTIGTLAAAHSSGDLLVVLKDLKNSVIGNTWKKVQVAGDDEVLAFLLQWLELPVDPIANPASIDIIVEIAVIIGALSNVGTLTLRPLLLSQAPTRLLNCIRATSNSRRLSASDRVRLLSALLRALRNVLVATADLVWGYMRGVSLRRRVVDTGLAGPGESRVSEAGDTGGGATAAKKAKGKEVDRGPGGGGGKEMAAGVLSMVFEKENLDTLLALLDYSTNLQIMLPLYQLLARLIALPSHREALASWSPPKHHPSSSETSSSLLFSSSNTRLTGSTTSPASTRSGPKGTPYILAHLLSTISPPAPSSGIPGLPGGASTARRNPKMLEATLDLLAALLKGQPDLAAVVRDWPVAGGSEGIDESEEGFVGELRGLMGGASTPVRIAAASCITNLVKAECPAGLSPIEDTSVRRGVLKRHTLDVIVELLKGDGVEDRIKLCFVLASLVSDESSLQRAAADRGCPTALLGFYVKLEDEESRDELGSDPASRARESILLALAALAFQTESNRALIAEYQPPFLPHLLRALRHPSYGVRAGGCQLARALSRSIAVLRTNLIDSGVADEVIELLRRECSGSGWEGAGERVGMDEGVSSEDRGWAVEVAAMGTLCNLVPDFSPLRTKLLANGGLSLLISLTRSPHEPLALNALWAVKNLTFRAAEGIKASVMAEMGYAPLKNLMMPSTPTPLRVQAFCILRNLVADQTPAELSRTTEAFGEDRLLDVLQSGLRDKDQDMQAAALFTVANLALGNERMRQALVSHVDLIEGLSDALNSNSDDVKHAALKTLRHLIEASTRSRRPRQAMLELFLPYQLRPRVQELMDNSEGFDVRHAAGGLLEVLERGRGEVGFGTAR